MLQDRNIAFFIDVDNVRLSSEQYADIINQLNAMGTILSGKVYGAGERKHKEIYADADLKGYTMARPMRIKRRGRKDFDARIFVDVADAISHVPAIDAVCIIAQPTDLVHLYSYLRSHGVKIIALDNADDASNAFIDEVIDLGIVLELQPPKPAKKPAKKAAPAKAEPAPQTEDNSDLERTNELLREIERLKAMSAPSETTEEPAAEEPATEQPTEEPSNITDETYALLERIAELQEQEAAAPEQKQEPTEETAPEETPEQAGPSSRVSYSPSNERDLIRRIEEIRNNSQGDDDEYIDEIQKLLDGLE